RPVDKVRSYSSNEFVRIGCFEISSCIENEECAIVSRMKRWREGEEEVEEEEEEEEENFHDPCIYHAASLSFIWDKALV
ncbi:hypothetical protein V1478_017822, partial [Vespula squamosa]